MSEIRAQVAYHFKFDPARETTGRAQLPEMITRTVAVGDELVTEKIASIALPASDRTALLTEMEKQIREATRTARPAGSAQAAAVEEPAETEEESAF